MGSEYEFETNAKRAQIWGGACRGFRSRKNLSLSGKPFWVPKGHATQRPWHIPFTCCVVQNCFPRKDGNRREDFSKHEENQADLRLTNEDSKTIPRPSQSLCNHCEPESSTFWARGWFLRSLSFWSLYFWEDDFLAVNTYLLGRPNFGKQNEANSAELVRVLSYGFKSPDDHEQNGEHRLQRVESKRMLRMINGVPNGLV